MVIYKNLVIALNKRSSKEKISKNYEKIFTGKVQKIAFFHIC